ncbi:Retrovirus-related Pol polyprotein from transposon TNT 1-94 [Ceratocystis lukuohia]|uniref:Retrovirus-related Pol polyprotein from transposon TNT 1-94 n=1 Tax=Ceratocystis lukuohia TaxID=2019550 RepID=A0ABR4MA68_9PEZI
MDKGIKAVRTDNAPELKKLALEWQNEYGSDAQLTIPGTSSQNRAAERAIRTINDQGSLTLEEACQENESHALEVTNEDTSRETNEKQIAMQSEEIPGAETGLEPRRDATNPIAERLTDDSALEEPMTTALQTGQTHEDMQEAKMLQMAVTETPPTKSKKGSTDNSRTSIQRES